MKEYACVNKVRVLGLVAMYELIETTTGETRNLKRAELRSALERGAINVINLEVTPGGRIIDKKVDNKSSENASASDSKTVNTKAESKNNKVICNKQVNNTTSGKIKCKSLHKFRDKHGTIKGYRLVDTNGKQIDLESDKLKAAISSGQLEVVNLTLTSDGRLVDKSEDNIKATGNKAVMSVKDIVNKAMESGCEVYTEAGCYVWEQSTGSSVIAIPDNVVELVNDNVAGWQSNKWLTLLNSLKDNHIKVIGGKGLKSTRFMFYNCYLRSIDLSGIEAHNITNSECMFNHCRAQSINLAGLDTSKVTNMHSMFSNCETSELNLSSFDTHNVENMRSMFMKCVTSAIHLDNFDTGKVKNMRDMFNCCTAKVLNPSKFNTSNVTDMWGTFKGCYVQELNLSNLDTSKVQTMGEMFKQCKSKVINLSKFNTTNVVNMSSMFEDCTVRELNLSSFDTSKTQNLACIFDRCNANIVTTDAKLLEAIKQLKSLH